MNYVKRILYFFCIPCRPQKSFTVRYAFPLVFTFAALLGAAAAITSDTRSSIRLETSQSSVRAGERFEINVFANAKVAVNAVDIQLNFPTDQIKILGIDTGESVITLWTRDPYVENNTVYLQGGTFRRGFIGDHLIATINAQAVETGLAKVTVGDATLLAGDGSGSKVAVSKNDDETSSIFVAASDGTYTEIDPSTADLRLKSSASIVIVTDIDGDGRVTVTDISRFMLGWASRTVVYDFNGDGFMTFRDFGIILSDSFFQ